MEHESFEHAGIAALLNAHFVAVKVDREERPDIDRVYMLFVQATTGQGGWPMSVFLTPDLEPFYGGTYFPPTARFGRPGFLEVLQEISRTWREERARVVASAATLTERLREATRPEPQPDGGVHIAPPAALDAALALYVQAYDGRFGGFGTAPKFPRPSELLLLLRHHALSGNPEGARDDARDVAGDVHGRAARPRGRRVSPLLGGRDRGACRTSRRCSTTRRSWPSRCSKRRRRRAIRSTPRWPRTRWPTSRAN